MSAPQSGILNPVPNHARYMEFTLRPGSDPGSVLRTLTKEDHNPGLVIGMGASLVGKMGGHITSLKPFPSVKGTQTDIPSTQADLLLILNGEEPGEIVHQSRTLETLLTPVFKRVRLTDGFKFGEGRDLTGYIDGTENPEGADAVAAALFKHPDPGLDGSSFVAIQQWAHDLNHFESLPRLERDHIIGRRVSDNEELEDAPLSAHVKRTAQESFDPEAFIVRRSLPWSDATGDGLMFVAYGRSFEAFEAQLKRMVGLEDGIMDGLFQFSRPISGGYYWCPPLVNGKLCLQKLGL